MNVGEDPNEDENMSASDSDCSQDNFEDDELYRDIYVRDSLKDKEILLKNKALVEFRKEVVNSSKQVDSRKVEQKKMTDLN